MTAADQKKILELKRRYSIYAPWSDGAFFRKIIDSLARPYLRARVDKVLGLDARGFVLGAALAYRLGVGFAVCRKAGKMYQEGYDPSDVLQESTTDYSGTVKTLEIEKTIKGIRRGDRVVIVDDWFETGGQSLAAIRLVERAGGVVVGVTGMLDDTSEKTRAKLESYGFHPLVRRVVNK